MKFQKNDSRPIPRERFLKEDDEYYHSKSKNGEFISSHLLLTFAENPFKYHLLTSGALTFPSDTAAFAFGRAAHCYVLEGQKEFNERYVVSDGVINERTGKPYGKETKAYLDWVASLPGGTKVVSNDEYNMIRAMDNAIRNHAEASSLLDGAEPERVLRTHLFGVNAQARFDGIGAFGNDEFKPYIIDLKTVSDIGEFERDIYKYKYDYQAAYYRLVFNAVCGFMPDFYFVAVEKQEPFTVGVWKMDGDLLSDAEEKVKVIIKELSDCIDNDEWRTGYEEIRVISAKRRVL